eukprot:TRINITY_DN5195_c0_g1_i1.p1 TRINITY_DN5195_c0_g1~~TRINITY_DN5195_c0_g1_i1.p1  ORF type:complete len:167 (+),score=40.29 TRINITY_DN5195_c0_g1_i1:53-553(+)
MEEIPLSLKQRPADVFFIAFFIIHIPTAILMDGQMVLPPWLFPQFLQKGLSFHILTFQDFLVRERPSWFLGLIWCELLLQVPFFLAGTYAFIKGKEWIRTPALLYCAQASGSMVPILAAIVTEVSMSVTERAALGSLYLPFLIIPILFLHRCLPEKLFHAQKSKTT